MEATVPGPNRTGGAVNPEGIALMLEAVNELSPPMQITMRQSEIERQRYISESDSVGSISPPRSALKGTVARIKGATGARTMSVLLDKLGERIAFERAGTRLYDAVITKYLALANDGEIPLPPGADGEAAIETLVRIRNEELQHFQMLTRCMEDLGGDATAMTPCADVTATASIGLLQVVTDPRTTLAQSLNAVLTAELTDTAGWELLSELAELAGQNELTTPFVSAFAAEEEHVEIVRGWLRNLITDAPGTPAV
jgi:hypothetical protein